MTNREYIVRIEQTDVERLVTKDIQQVIDQCHEDGGGKIIIPTGKYRIGNIRLYSNMELHLCKDAILVGSVNWWDYEDFHVPSTIDYIHSPRIIEAWNLPKHYFNAMITAFGEEHITITGEDGATLNGSNCFDAAGEEKFRGPMGMVFSSCKDINLWMQQIGHTNWTVVQM